MDSKTSSIPKAPEAPKAVPVVRNTIQAHDIKKGTYVIIRGKPCRVIDVKVAMA